MADTEKPRESRLLKKTTMKTSWIAKKEKRRMNRHIFLLVILVQAASGLLQAQINCCTTSGYCGNLICNPSFEYYQTMPNCESNSFDGDDVCAWNVPANACGTPNYFHKDFIPSANPGCNLDFSPPSASRVIENFNTQIYPPVQEGYAGLYTYRTYINNTSYYWREYIQQQFQSPLTPGTYSFTMYVTLGEISDVASKLQVFFSNTAPSYSGNTSPVCHDRLSVSGTGLYTFGPFTSFNGWTAVTATVTVPVGTTYNYITIGNFETNSNSGLVNVTPSLPNGESDPMNICYYAIDDISISKTGGPCCAADVFMAPNDIPGSGGDVYLSNYAITPGQTIFVDEWTTLHINQNATFTNNIFQFAPNAAIVVDGPYNLTFNTCQLYACWDMWQGIKIAVPGATFNMTNSTLKHAIRGLDAYGGIPITMTDCGWDQNYDHIVLQNFTGTWSPNLQRNNFYCTVPLRNPYLGQNGMDGIKIINVAQVNINAPTWTDRNRFRQSTYGIYADRSGLSCINNFFYQIDKYTRPASACIYATNGNNTLRTISASGNQFTSSNHGINAVGNFTLNFTSNTANMIAEVAFRGESVFQRVSNPVPTINISSNTVIQTLVGVDLFKIKNTTSNINYNNIYNTTGNPFSYGIRLANDVLATTSQCSTAPPIQGTGNPIKILGNIINKYWRGIQATTMTCMQVKSNYIDMQHPGGSDQYFGTLLQDCRYSDVMQNTITGTFTDLRCLGIGQAGSPYCNVGCNTINTCGTDLYIIYNNLNSYYFNNDFNNSLIGIMFNGGALISNQMTVGATNYAQKNRWTNTSYHIYSYATNAAPFKFWFHNLATPGTPERPNPFISVYDIASGATPVIVDYTTDLTGNVSTFYNCGVQAIAPPEPIPGNQSSIYSLNTNAVEELIRNDEYSKAHELIHSGKAFSESEQLFNQVAELYLLRQEQKNTGAFAGNSIAKLRSIAAGCPGDLGNAVWLARTLLEQAGETFEIAACEKPVFHENRNNVPEKETVADSHPMTVFPNPATDFVSITPFAGTIKAAVYSLDGRLIETQTLTSDKPELNISKLAPGVYLLNLESANKTQTIRLIKQ